MPERKAIPPHLQRKLNGSAASATSSAPPASPASANDEHALVLSIANIEERSPTPITTVSSVSAGLQNNFTPTEMIQHDLINRLRLQVEHLSVKCDALKEENAQLKQAVEELELHANGEPMGDHQPRNLVGYESSDDGNPQEAETKGNLSEEIGNQIAVILNRHEDRLASLEARFIEKMAPTQGTVDDTKIPMANGTFPGLLPGGDGSLAKNVSDLEQTVESGQHQVNVHHLALQDLQDWRNQIENQEFKASDKSTDAPALQYDADFQARSERRLEQEGRIDNAYTREELLQHYVELCQLITHYHDDGNFRGTEDELWALRERVVMNLATFDAREKALEEARKWMEYNA